MQHNYFIIIGYPLSFVEMLYDEQNCLYADTLRDAAL